MKRLLIASMGLPPAVGGAPHVAWETAIRLAGTYEVHVLTTQSDLLDDQRVVFHQVPRYPLDTFPDFLRTLTYSSISRRAIRSAIAEASPDIIHSHKELPWGYVLRNESRAKRLITMHSLDPKQSPKLFVERALRRANVILSPSKWFAEYAKKIYNVSPQVIPNGVDTESFKPVVLLKPKNIVLFVGRFSAEKGISELMQAARFLPDCEFWLIGKTYVTHRISSRPHNVRIIGFVPHLELPRYYAMASVCAFPSHREVFSLVGLEAMACGRAIVATHRGFSEYVEDGRDGFLVKPHNVEALVHVIRRLIYDEGLRTQIEKNARKKALEYDWSKVVNLYIELYDRLLK